MKKIYTKVSIDAGLNNIRELSGRLSVDDFELVWDLMDIVWKVHAHTDIREIENKALKEIRNIIEKYNEDIEKI